MTRSTDSGLGPDIVPNGEWVNHAAVKERLHRLIIWPGSRIGLDINPVTTVMATVVIWVFVAICLSMPIDSMKALTGGQSWITDIWTWLYIGTQNAWIIFIIILYFSKYGKLKLGKPEDKPEYSNLTWFMMLFSCGVGNELFYFGVAEPMYHYTLSAKQGHPNRYSHMNPNERAQWSLETTFYHWGLHGWVVYAIIGLSISFMGYRKGLPVTMRSCLYPLLGDKTFGIMGDVIDMVSAVCTLMGVCTSLGLGVMDVNAGIARLSGCPAYPDVETCNANASCTWNDLGRCKQYCDYLDESACNVDVNCRWKADVEECYTLPDSKVNIGYTLTRDHQITLIWIITFIATLSVVTGMKMGIRTLSVTCFSIGMFLWMYVFLSDNPWYFLDVFTQQIGMYVQYIFQIGFHTDAYARHTNAPPVVSHGFEEQPSAHAGWIDHWTMFYWGWWIAWSPFVGMFIAKISRGRTIREFINGTMTAPMIYVFTWFNVFGASGLKLERLAENAGLLGKQSPAYLLMDSAGFVDIANTCAGPLVDNCVYVSRLSERPQYEMWMDMIGQFFQLANLMMPISLVAILLYFVTSSDSGSLVIDCLCSNGVEDPPIPQKIYWAFTEGACATALIYVGYVTDDTGTKALKALQAASICSGLPYTIMLCLMCGSLWKACKYEWGDMVWCKERFFRTDLMDVCDIQWTKAYLLKLGRTIYALLDPVSFLSSSLPHSELTPKQRLPFTIVLRAFYYMWFLFMLLEYAVQGLFMIGWWWFFCFIAVLCAYRSHLRTLKNIEGNIAEDWFACMLFYFCVVEQLDAHFREENGRMSDDYAFDERKMNSTSNVQCEPIGCAATAATYCVASPKGKDVNSTSPDQLRISAGLCGSAEEEQR